MSRGLDLAVEGQLARGELTSFGKALLLLVVPTLGFLALLCYLAGVVAWRKRSSVWTKIRDESRATTQ